MTSNNLDTIYKVYKDVKELQNSLKLNGDIESACKTTAETMQKFAISLKDVYDSQEATMKMLKSGMVFLEETRNIRKMIRDIDTKKLSRISEQLKSLSLSDIQGVSKSLNHFVDIDYLVQFKDLSLVFETYDSMRLSKIMQHSLNRIDWSQVVSVDEITEEIAEQYIEEELAEQKHTGGKDSDVQNSQIDKRQLKKDVEGTISLWVGIISLIFAIWSHIYSKPTVVNNTYNNITEVTYNYTIEMGIDAEVLNALGYRIINQNNVMPRIKPDCSSTVTGHLYIGQVVNVTDKWKKWIEITWKNDDGEYCSGWIQNYKVSEFR